MIAPTVITVASKPILNVERRKASLISGVRLIQFAAKKPCKKNNADRLRYQLRVDCARSRGEDTTQGYGERTNLLKAQADIMCIIGYCNEDRIGHVGVRVADLERKAGQ